MFHLYVSGDVSGDLRPTQNVLLLPSSSLLSHRTPLQNLSQRCNNSHTNLFSSSFFSQAFRLSTLTLARSLRAAVRPQMRGFSSVATLRAKPGEKSACTAPSRKKTWLASQTILHSTELIIIFIKPSRFAHTHTHETFKPHYTIYTLHLHIILHTSHHTPPPSLSSAHFHITGAAEQQTAQLLQDFLFFKKIFII